MLLHSVVRAVERAVSDGHERADILMLLAAIRGGEQSDSGYWRITFVCTLLLSIEIKKSPEELTEGLISLLGGVFDIVRGPNGLDFGDFRRRCRCPRV
jgi:hypothetical protein